MEVGEMVGGGSSSSCLPPSQPVVFMPCLPVCLVQNVLPCRAKRRLSLSVFVLSHALPCVIHQHKTKVGMDGCGVRGREDGMAEREGVACGRQRDDDREAQTRSPKRRNREAGGQA